MRIDPRTVSVAVVIALSGCGEYGPPPVHVVGDETAMQSLAGTWHGTFRNPQLLRKGKIDFRMSAAADSAFGEVSMYMDTPSQPIWLKPQPPGGPAASPTPSWLRIRFVRIEQGYVSGEMEPMFEPRCNCFTVSRFIGRLRGSIIDGSYTSRSDDGRWESSGSWHVERVPSP